MSEDKDNEKKFNIDFSKETNDELIEDFVKTIDQKIDPIAEANESLITMDSAPFDQTLEIMSQTLASIDAKMDVENSQLQKLDQLSEIKDQLNRMENTSLATATEEVALYPKVTAETENKIEEDVPQSNIGHNQQEISELLEKIQTLENKIQAIESQSNSSNKRFEKIESIVGRFEYLKNEIQVEYEKEEKPNLFKKEEKKEPYKKEITLNAPEIQLKEVKMVISKDPESITEEAEGSLENTSKEILINEVYDEEISKENEKPKSKNLNYGLWMLLLLTTVITILFFFNKFQIIDLSFNFQIIVLSFNKFVNSIFFLIDSILK